jgi:ceramide glucosyltransferase
VGHVCHEESLADLLRHQLRWARTVRSIDMPGYLGSFISHPFGLALLGVAAGSASCLALAVMAIGLRVGLYKAVERSFELSRQAYWLAPITDLIAFGVFVWSFFGTSVTWKRASYTVLGDGRMAQSH